MDKNYNDQIRPLLDLADRLTVLLDGTPIKIPRIASCGMQSHGKSSILESITHISLPKGDGTVTICPIKISLRNAKDEEYARITRNINLEEIKATAIGEYGMSYARDGQIIVVEDTRSDYVYQVSDLPEDE